MAVVKKVFKELGILVGKEVKEASEAKEFRIDGQLQSVPAQPTRYVLKVVSSEDIDQTDGMTTPSLTEYVLNDNLGTGSYANATADMVALFDSLKYLDKVYVKLEMSTSGTFKAVGVVPYKKN
ncbi:MAG: hypothetical protein IJZ29_05335 [Clostridia bacterium]|nr:hypothetical protein [Clostridia bacterium]